MNDLLRSFIDAELSLLGISGQTQSDSPAEQEVAVQAAPREPFVFCSEHYRQAAG